ncbi:hypothetical protein ABZ946_36515 [Streptomyces sp. NPDC046324]|uniref:hypothetical protein n=1 Tax=Streptomyces sp. NPDC046324 TaxID=3154915 RepID=UPI0033C159E3
MSGRNTALRSLRDVGLATWFGGSLMGAVGLNGAAEAQSHGDWALGARTASSVWSQWAPVGAAAIGMHMVGTSGLLAANAARVVTQPGVAASTIAKTALTGAALAATAYTRMLGKKIEYASSERLDDAKETDRHSAETKKAARHLAVMQWVVPALTGGLLVLNAVHGEQQRPAQQLYALWKRYRRPAPYMPNPGRWHFTS